MKLSLCMIVRNEEKDLPVLFSSIKDCFDEVVILDTGSTDDTKLICESSLGATLKYETFEWCDDFSAARQKSFDLATGDWIVWADADDVIKNAKLLRSVAEDCNRDGINAVVFPYHYVVDKDGNTTVLQTRERLIKNDGTYRWIGKLHETLVPQNKTAIALSLTSVEWIHKAGAERTQKSKERNLRILEKALEQELIDENVDPRTVYNLGNAYYTVDDYERAVGCYLQYIPLSGWIEERYLARHRASLCFFNMRNFARALEMAFTAIEEKPEYPDGYIDVGKIYYEKEDFNKALHWFLEATKRESPKKLPVFNPMDYSANLFWLIGHTYTQLNEFKKARPYFLEFEKYYPKNEQIKEILTVIDNGIKEAELVRAITTVGSELKTKDFWKLIPTKFMEYPEVMHEKNKIITRTSTGGKDMAIYCGNCVVEWDGDSDKDGGIGGSEEAVINITKRLVPMGWNITVYGRPRKEGIYDGVEYKHYTDFNPNDKWDVFVSWRMPSVFSVDINAKKKYCWLHDCTPEDAFSGDILRRIDKIIVLSKYHRSLYPGIPEEKFLYSGNGIDPQHFAWQRDKIKNRCIYTSSPDRGLECLLELWPKIIKEVPDATLHWYYGWEVFDKLHKDNPEKQEYKAKIKKLLDQPGVFEGGRITHDEIAEEYKKAEFWLYPTEFTETYCITAAKAQAAGAYPITTTVAALDETVQYGTKYPVRDMYSNQESKDKFVEDTVHLMKNPDEVKLEIDGMIEWACGHFDWINIAKQWDNELI